MDSSNVPNVKDEIFHGFEEDISSAFKMLHPSLQSLVNKLIQRQKNRYPKKLVFIIDKEEVQFETEQFGELVKIVKIVNLNFSNAIESLKHQDLIGRGYLFIISCGLYTLITGTASKLCVQMKCSKPLNTYTVDPEISFKDLALQALKLQEYILNNSTDDQVMFCDIIPINISSSVLRTCENKHSLRQTTRPEIYIKYLNTINEYNKFVDVHCQIFGFKNMNLLNIFFPSKAYNITHPVDFMFDFREVDDEHVFNSINDSIYNLLTKMEVNMDEMPEVFVFKSVTKSKLSGISALKLFEKIVIVTSRQYAPYFELLKCEQVRLTFARSYGIDAIAEAVKIRKKFEPKRTLWLTHMEIFQTAGFKCSEKCSSCAEPLEIFIPPNQSSMTDYVTEIQNSFSALAKNVSSFLDAESSFAILPPFPPTILVLEKGDHQLYHDMYMERKMFYLVTKGSMNQFESFIELNKQLITLSIAEFEKANISSHSLVDYSDLVISWSSYVDIPFSENNSDGVSNAKYLQWLEYSIKLISENLEFKVDEGKVCPAISTQHTEDKTSNALPINVQNPMRAASSVPEFTNSRSNNYDHIVFIYFSEEHSLIIPEEKDNANNISSVMLNSDQTWSTSKFDSFVSKGFKNILFIILGSLKLLGITCQEEYCLINKCKKPLSYLQMNSLDIVQDTKEKLNVFVQDLEHISGTKSTVIIAPFICVNCASKSSDLFNHNIAHWSCLNARDLYLMDGSMSTWHGAGMVFKDIWHSKMDRQFLTYFPTKILDLKILLLNFKNILMYPMKVVNLTYTTNSNFYHQYKLLLGGMLRIICPFISLQGFNMLWIDLARSVPSNTGKNQRSKISKIQPAVQYSTQTSYPGRSSASTRSRSFVSSDILEVPSSETSLTHSEFSNKYIGSSVPNIANVSECDTSSLSWNLASQGGEERYQIVGYPMNSGQVSNDHLTTDYTAGTCYSGGRQATERPLVGRNNSNDNYLADDGHLTKHATGSSPIEGLSATDLQSSTESRNSNQITHRSRSRDRRPSYALESSSWYRRRSYSNEKGKSSHSKARKDIGHRSRDRERSRSKTIEKLSYSMTRKEARHRSKERSYSKSRSHSSSLSRYKRRKLRSESISKHSRKKRRTKSPTKSQSKSRAGPRSTVHQSKSSHVHTSKNNETICSDIITTDRLDFALANFSVSGALVLENMSDKLGVLGPILKSIINNVNLDLKANRIQALNTIKDEDTIIFLKMTVDKLRKILQSAPLSEISLISKTIEFTTRLISYAEKIPKQEMNINLKAIAAASINKPPEFTISLIKATLAYESSETVTKEEVNEIYMKVCSIQCEMIDS